MKLNQLTRLIKEEITKLKTENHAGYMREKENPEWWMNCNDDEGCFGTINFNDQSVDAGCCAKLMQNNPSDGGAEMMGQSRPRTNPMSPNKF